MPASIPANIDKAIVQYSMTFNRNTRLLLSFEIKLNTSVVKVCVNITVCSCVKHPQVIIQCNTLNVIVLSSQSDVLA